jgi:nucleotide-binding universal stress UspA family protein
MSWFPKRCVVVPVDFSDDSFAAVELALDLVAEPAGLHLIHVLPEPHAGDPWRRMADDRQREPSPPCDRSDPHTTVRRQVPVGDHRDRVRQSGVPDCGIRRADGAELIVIPSHGRTGLKRLMLGSVTERVIRLSHCPVLVLRK